MEITNNQFQDYLKNPNEHNFFLKETEPQDVSKILRELNAKKAKDIYGISPKFPKFVKIAADVLKNHLKMLFNHSINQGIFRDKLKAGLIHPIHKGASKSVCSNYRPISFLSLFSKVFGFQRGKSSEHAVLDLYTNILQAIETKEKTSCIVLDFSKAFDTVNHKILLSKLEHYVIRGLPLIWKQYQARSENWKVYISQTLKLSLVESPREVY